MYLVFGIKNCTTVKKALAWLDEREIAYRFVDFKKTNPTQPQIAEWMRQVGWEALLNKRGTTWRQLSDTEKAAIVNAQTAATLLQQKPTIIKRPLIEKDGHVCAIGFDEKRYETLLAT